MPYTYRDGDHFCEQTTFLTTNEIFVNDGVVHESRNDRKTTFIVQRNEKRSFLKTNVRKNKNERFKIILRKL